MGDGAYTSNFKLDRENQKLQMILGVLRSRMTSGSGFVVDIKAVIEESRQLVASGSIASSFVPADDTYALPDAVTVSSNKLSESFYLEVAFSTILVEENAGKKLILEVGLENPPHYEPVGHKTSTTVIIGRLFVVLMIKIIGAER